MVLEKHRRVLGDGFKLFAQGGKRRAVDGVRMAHRQNVGMRLMDGRMQHKAGPVDRMRALDHLAVVVHQNQVGHPDLRKMHRHRVGPVQLRALRIAHCQVAGEAIVKALQGKGPAGGNQALLAMLPLLGRGGKHRHFGELQAHLLGLVDGYALDDIEHGALLG